MKPDYHGPQPATYEGLPNCASCRPAPCNYYAALRSYGNLPYVASTVACSLLLLRLAVLPVDHFRKRFGARVPTLHDNVPAAATISATRWP